LEFSPISDSGGISITVDPGWLDIPLKDNIKGWRLEWFIMENHGKSLPPRSGRQLDVRTPSWVESPTFSEITKAKVLLAEICLLKDRGLTAEVVVADFVFKNIQPLKDRIYPAYLYTGISDSTRVTNRKIPNEDLLSRLDMILRGRVSNAGAPLAYSAWNLPPNRPFSEFASNPLARDGSPGHRVRPSPGDIEALIAPLWSLPEAERQTHFEMPASTDDVEMDAVLSLLAEESSDSTRADGHHDWTSVRQRCGDPKTRRCSPKAFTPSEPPSCTCRGEKEKEATSATIVPGSGCWSFCADPWRCPGGRHSRG
jgi:hypothetical protein